MTEGTGLHAEVSTTRTNSCERGTIAGEIPSTFCDLLFAFVA
jgi:hypothetical protein